MSLSIKDERAILIKVSGIYYDEPSEPIAVTNASVIYSAGDGSGVYKVADISQPVTITKVKSAGVYTHSLFVYKINGVEWGMPAIADTEENSITITIPHEYFTAARFIEVAFSEVE